MQNIFVYICLRFTLCFLFPFMDACFPVHFWKFKFYAHNTFYDFAAFVQTMFVVSFPVLLFICSLTTCERTHIYFVFWHNLLRFSLVSRKVLPSRQLSLALGLHFSGRIDHKKCLVNLLPRAEKFAAKCR